MLVRACLSLATNSANLPALCGKCDDMKVNLGSVNETLEHELQMTHEAQTWPVESMQRRHEGRAFKPAHTRSNHHVYTLKTTKNWSAHAATSWELLTVKGRKDFHVKTKSRWKKFMHNVGENVRWESSPHIWTAPLPSPSTWVGLLVSLVLCSGARQ